MCIHKKIINYNDIFLKFSRVTLLPIYICLFSEKNSERHNVLNLKKGVDMRAYSDEVILPVILYLDHNYSPLDQTCKF